MSLYIVNRLNSLIVCWFFFCHLQKVALSELISRFRIRRVSCMVNVILWFREPKRFYLGALKELKELYIYILVALKEFYIYILRILRLPEMNA
jgi:hypothetical protein